MGTGIEAWVLALATAASTSVSIAESAKKIKAPEIMTPEAPADLSGDAARTAQRMAEQRRRQAGQHGRASTIMSDSPLGQPGQANTSSKYLTGA
jgi:hypothetical protein